MNICTHKINKNIYWKLLTLEIISSIMIITNKEREVLTMIRMHVENNVPVAEISIFELNEFVNVAYEIFMTHKYNETTMTYTNKVELFGDRCGWSTVGINIEISSYYRPHITEIYKISFSFVENDDEYDNLFNIIETYKTEFNEANRPHDFQVVFESLRNEINEYYGVD